MLFIVFGSLFAMLLPLLSALVSLGTALGVIGLLSHVLKMPEFSAELVLLIGLGVGVDYALFIVSRHRQGLFAGRDVESSRRDVARHVRPSRAVRRHHRVHRAARHVRAGRSASCTGWRSPRASACSSRWPRRSRCCPRCSASSGRRSCRGASDRSCRPAIRLRRERAEGFWDRWARTVERRPVAVGHRVLVLVVLLFALPFLSLRLGSSDQGNDPPGHDDAAGLRPAGARASGPASTARSRSPRASHGAGDEAGPAAGRRRPSASDPDVAAVTPPVVITGQDGTKVGRLGRLPEVGAAGRGDHRPDRPPARQHDPGGGAGLARWPSTSAASRRSSPTSPTC